MHIFCKKCMRWDKTPFQRIIILYKLRNTHPFILIHVVIIGIFNQRLAKDCCLLSSCWSPSLLQGGIHHSPYSLGQFFSGWWYKPRRAMIQHTCGSLLFCKDLVHILWLQRLKLKMVVFIFVYKYPHTAGVKEDHQRMCPPLPLAPITGSDWATDVEDWKSLFGYVINFAGVLIG